MQHSHHEHSEGSASESWLFSRTGIATIVAVSVLSFLIYQGHGAHLLGFLPYLLILSCPLMHIFMHGGHGGRQHNEEDTSALTPEEKKKREVEQKQHKHGGCH